MNMLGHRPMEIVLQRGQACASRVSKRTRNCPETLKLLNHDTPKPEAICPVMSFGIRRLLTEAGAVSSRSSAPIRLVEWGFECAVLNPEALNRRPPDVGALNSQSKVLGYISTIESNSLTRNPPSRHNSTSNSHRRPPYLTRRLSSPRSVTHGC